MSRKLCVVIAIAAFVSLEFMAVQSTEAQLFRRMLGRRNQNNCPTCCTDCGTQAVAGPVVSTPAVTSYAAPVATYEATAPVASYVEPAMSYVQSVPVASYVEPVSYAAPAPMEYTSAPYTEATSESSCGCGGEVGYQATPAEPMITSPVGVTPATYTSGCIGCEGMTLSLIHI